MAGDVICGECPKVYPAKEIEAYDGEQKVATLADLQPDDRSSKGGNWGERASRAFFGVRPKREPELPDFERGLRRLRGYTFFCPKGHRVDGNAGEQFPLAMLGASGASKSHMLPAIVHELDDKRTLSPLGITLTEALYSDPKLALDVRDLYRQGLKLRRTDPGTLLGPFGYKLKVRSQRQSGKDRKLSLILFDVAGEDLQGIVKIADKARFILLCKALMILIDPVGFLPTQFESNIVTNERTKIHAARDVRSGIRVIAETLAEVWNVNSSRDLPIPVCFVLAKADAIEWGTGFDWKRQTADVIAGGSDDGDLSEALQASSAATREAFVSIGGDLVVEEIEDLFNDRWVRYTAASATSSMPTESPDASGREWEAYPDPNGAALALLQLLDLAEVLRPRAVAIR